MKIACSYCGSVFEPGNRPNGAPNGMGFQLEDGCIINLCYHCICNLADDPKMQKWLENYGKGEI